ncbi:hypothetical protein J6590_054959 [Homalodisca vitripennis]|nr:hypothetical protein J6590_054959 [Homalodisca vitripennis]
MGKVEGDGAGKRVVNQNLLPVDKGPTKKGSVGALANPAGAQMPSNLRLEAVRDHGRVPGSLIRLTGGGPEERRSGMLKWRKQMSVGSIKGFGGGLK